ncbi:MAG: Gmad2 immunoglobulin-like domain-containing protein [Candidatus Limnocylindrales bacterium]
MIATRASTRQSVAARLLALGGTIFLLAACAGGPGSVGPVITRAPETNAPSDSPTGIPSSPPDGTPVPSDIPTQAPGSPGPTAAPTPAGTTDVKIYLLLGGQLVAVQRHVPQTVAVGRAALEALIDGPATTESALQTTVPSGTLVLGLVIKDGLATVDLSREFEAGGGSASMFGRLAQVVYTLTQFPTVDRVAFELDGEPVTVFSGEGIVLDHPSVRADYVSYLPPMFMDRPAWGGTATNPVRITGVANVFEATFLIEIRDAAGNSLAQRQVMATCGSGCWGTFDVTIPYSIGSTQVGSVVVFNRSAKDGSVEDLIAYPVTLTP